MGACFRSSGSRTPINLDHSLTVQSGPPGRVASQMRWSNVTTQSSDLLPIWGLNCGRFIRPHHQAVCDESDRRLRPRCGAVKTSKLTHGMLTPIHSQSAPGRARLGMSTTIQGNPHVHFSSSAFASRCPTRSCDCARSHEPRGRSRRTRRARRTPAARENHRDSAPGSARPAAASGNAAHSHRSHRLG